MGFSDLYTKAFAGKTVLHVKQEPYQPLEVHFTDGTCAIVEASGVPPSIFMSQASSAPPLMATVFKVEACL